MARHPATVGTVYSTAIPVAANLTIKAIAYKTGMGSSTVSSAAYTIAVAALYVPNCRSVLYGNQCHRVQSWYA
jgi:hypothetical protein